MKRFKELAIEVLLIACFVTTILHIFIWGSILVAFFITGENVTSIPTEKVEGIIISLTLYFTTVMAHFTYAHK